MNIEVFLHGNASPFADSCVAATEARRLVVNGLARRINSNRAIRLERGVELRRVSSHGCEFKKLKLREYRATIVACIRNSETSSEGLSPRVAALMRVVCDIDKLRVNHESVSGCKCWYDAPEDADQEPLPPVTPAELKAALLRIAGNGTRSGFLFAKEMFAKYPELRRA